MSTPTERLAMARKGRRKLKERMKRVAKTKYEARMAAKGAQPAKSV